MTLAFRLDPSLPIFQLSNQRVQLGVDPARGAVIDDPQGQVLTFLHRLRNRFATASDLELPATQQQQLLEQFAQLGLLEEQECPASSASVELIGSGQLGARVHQALSSSGLAELVADGCADADEPLTSLAYRLSEQTRRQVDLAIVTTDAYEVDRVITDSLVRGDQPHLLICGLGSGARVGPLVIPGSTPCVRCTDLTRRDLSDSWPVLLPQLCRTRAAPRPTSVEWAAATAVSDVLTWLSSQTSQLSGTTIEFGPPLWTTTIRDWALHPECGCAPQHWGV